MGQKLSPRDLELYKRCDEVLHYIWDPIGVSDVPPARDEYEGYLPQVFALVRDGAESEKIAQYLLSIETGAMGLAGAPDRARETADVLLAWREQLWSRAV
jgi:hypothetical protein